jgi:hypothetical protein
MILFTIGATMVVVSGAQISLILRELHQERSEFGCCSIFDMCDKCQADERNVEKAQKYGVDVIPLPVRQRLNHVIHVDDVKDA